MNDFPLKIILFKNEPIFLVFVNFASLISLFLLKFEQEFQYPHDLMCYY
jgi:hypothetical protein